MLSSLNAHNVNWSGLQHKILPAVYSIVCVTIKRLLYSLEEEKSMAKKKEKPAKPAGPAGKPAGYREGGIKNLPHNLAVDIKRNKVVYILLAVILAFFIIFHYIPMAGIFTFHKLFSL